MSDQNLHGLGIYQIWDQQNANRIEQKKKKNRRRKRVHSSSAFLNPQALITLSWD